MWARGFARSGHRKQLRRNSLRGIARQTDTLEQDSFPDRNTQAVRRGGARNSFAQPRSRHRQPGGRSAGRSGREGGGAGRNRRDLRRGTSGRASGGRIVREGACLRLRQAALRGQPHTRTHSRQLYRFSRIGAAFRVPYSQRRTYGNRPCKRI